MDVRAAFAVFLLFVATAKANTGGVSFWREVVTLTCPEEGLFQKAKTPVAPTLQPGPTKTYKFQYNNKEKGLYQCKYNDISNGEQIYYFYVQGKACSNCFELDATLFAVVIVADLSVTGLVMMIIFKCTKKKGPTGINQSNKAPSRSGGQGPPVPSPDYEQLNVHTRSQDTYSMVNRTG
ncbi:uncharacterized protein V6R79_008046 [Siganus canaliculatus]